MMARLLRLLLVALVWLRLVAVGVAMFFGFLLLNGFLSSSASANTNTVTVTVSGDNTQGLINFNYGEITNYIGGSSNLQTLSLSLLVTSSATVGASYYVTLGPFPYSFNHYHQIGHIPVPVFWTHWTTTTISAAAPPPPDPGYNLSCPATTVQLSLSSLGYKWRILVSPISGHEVSPYSSWKGGYFNDDGTGHPAEALYIPLFPVLSALPDALTISPFSNPPTYRQFYVWDTLPTLSFSVSLISPPSSAVVDYQIHNTGIDNVPNPHDRWWYRHRVYCSGVTYNGQLTYTRPWRLYNHRGAHTTLQVTTTLAAVTTGGVNPITAYGISTDTQGNIYVTAGAHTIAMRGILDLTSGFGFGDFVSAVTDIDLTAGFADAGQQVVETFSPLGAGLAGRISPFSGVTTTGAISCPVDEKLVDYWVPFPRVGGKGQSGSVRVSIGYEAFCGFFTPSIESIFRNMFAAFWAFILALRLVWAARG